MVGKGQGVQRYMEEANFLEPWAVRWHLKDEQEIARKGVGVDQSGQGVFGKEVSS